MILTLKEISEIDIDTLEMRTAIVSLAAYLEKIEGRLADLEQWKAEYNYKLKEAK